jgi:hypothetical protein
MKNSNDKNNLQSPKFNSSRVTITKKADQVGNVPKKESLSDEILLIDIKDEKIIDEVQQICKKLGLEVDNKIPDIENMFLSAWHKRRVE